MHGSAYRGHRYRLEHDAPARRERAARGSRPHRQGETPPVPRRRDRAVRPRFRCPRPCGGKGGTEDGRAGAREPRRRARRLSHRSRPSGGERRRARCRALESGGRESARPQQGGGGHARLSRRRSHDRCVAPVADCGVRRGRRVDRDRRRRSSHKPGLDRVGRSRLCPAHRARGRPPDRSGRRVRRRRSPGGRGRARSGRQRAARHAGWSARSSERPSSPRRCGSSRRSLRGRSPGATASTAPAQTSCPPESSCLPRCSGSSASRSTSATAGSARAPCSPRSKRSLPRELRTRPSSCRGPAGRGRRRRVCTRRRPRRAVDQPPRSPLLRRAGRRARPRAPVPPRVARRQSGTQRAYGLETIRRISRGLSSATSSAA